MTIKPNFIIACEQAFLTAGTNNLNLIGIFTNIHASQFPLTYRHFALVANFDIEERGSYELETVMKDPEGKEVVRSKLQANITANPFQVIANLENVIFPKPGNYELSISVGGTLVGSRTLYINPVVAKQNLA